MGEGPQGVSALLAHQPAAHRPADADATRVAGFKAWLALGYCVRKGETSIRIWGPMPPTKKQIEEWRKNGADPSEKPRTRFRMLPVFDTLSRDLWSARSRGGLRREPRPLDRRLGVVAWWRG
ncbi:MAG: ArdC family protein [Vicinamibacterales bacterium]